VASCPASVSRIALSAAARAAADATATSRCVTASAAAAMMGNLAACDEMNDMILGTGYQSESGFSM
jgi:hypothetical protein